MSMAYLSNKCAKHCCKLSVLVQLIVEDVVTVVTCFLEQTECIKYFIFLCESHCLSLKEITGARL